MKNIDQATNLCSSTSALQPLKDSGTDLSTNRFPPVGYRAYKKQYYCSLYLYGNILACLAGGPQNLYM